MLDMKQATALKMFREEMKVVQFDMAVTAGIRPNTYSRIERGDNVSYTTAQAILKALNMFRSNRNLPPVERVEDLGLTIV
jgi:DNA-binding XRE family transcriptional regulator